MSYPAELYRSLQCGNNFTSWNIPQRLIYLQMDIYVIHRPQQKCNENFYIISKCDFSLFYSNVMRTLELT